MTPTRALEDDVVATLPGAVPWHPDQPVWDASSSLRVGIDLVSIADVVESVRTFGDRYVYRIFTAHEVECCRSRGPEPGQPTAYCYQSLAARFAAKEAVVKVLRPVGPRPPWRDIEVYRTGSGWTEIRLSGRAAVLAAEAGIGDLAVSLTHEESTAAAVVLGMCRDGDRSPTAMPSTMAVRQPVTAGRDERHDH